MKLILTVILAMLASGCVVVPVNGKSAGGTALVCHKGMNTLELPQEAVRAHLNHGDRPGRC